MLIRCMNCGWRGDVDECPSYEEHIGDPFGFPAYERFYECPLCGSEDLEDEDDIDLIPFDEDEEK